MWVVELPIEIVYRSSSFAAILKHTKDVFGCSHISCSYLREIVETVTVPLRHVLSFPQLGLLWALRRRGFFTKPVGDPAFRWSGTYRAQGRSSFYSLEMVHSHSFHPWKVQEAFPGSPVQVASMSDVVSMGGSLLRLELGHQLHPDPVRTTEFAPALPPALKEAHTQAPPVQGYGPAVVGQPWKSGRFSRQDFALQPDGTLRCPAGQELRAHERRREADGSLRVVYAASIRSCRACSLREQCQWQGSETKKPRQVSMLLHPLAIGSQPIFWRDWSR